MRLGGIVAKGRIAVPIGPDMRMAAVASPAYFKKRPTPQTPQDLTDHSCINLRLPTHGGLYAWKFEKNKRELAVRVEGQLTFNAVDLMREAALECFGIAFVTEDQVRTNVEAGRIVQVLADWCPPFAVYHLYYPNRRHHSPAFVVLIKALRYRA